MIQTHSNGGNVMRWMMSNPTQDARYPVIINAIRWVNAIAPSSLGTPLADAAISGNVFESAVGWLLGYKSDAVRMQQQSWMANYNATLLYGTMRCPALPKRFYTVVGSDVDTSPFDGDSYCGGYQYNLGLEVTQAWLNSCSDGFLNCSSQTGAKHHLVLRQEHDGGQRAALAPAKPSAAASASMSSCVTTCEPGGADHDQDTEPEYRARLPAAVGHHAGRQRVGRAAVSA
ncbi:hypothetical protein LP419_10455 [Massilia sp. H-1]|nr:hypothetical protein LP419_10455 [Massilia sp. H-1]